MPKLLVNGFSMYAHTAGTGAPLLFIPGALGTGFDFAPQLSFFGKTHAVIAPDPRGYGESRPPERDYPAAFYQRDAEDMLALMTALGHEEFSIFGWSDGANIAVLMAIHAPARVRKMVVWGGNSFLSAEEMEAFEAMRSLSSWSPREVSSQSQIYGEALPGLWERYVTAFATSMKPEARSTARSWGVWSARRLFCMERRIRWYHPFTPASCARGSAIAKCMCFLRASTGFTRSMRQSSIN